MVLSVKSLSPALLHNKMAQPFPNLPTGLHLAFDGKLLFFVAPGILNGCVVGEID